VQQQQQHAWGAGGGDREDMNVDDATTATMHAGASGRASSHEKAAPLNFQQQHQSAGEKDAASMAQCGA
jgi:hypothetical protein